MLELFMKIIFFPIWFPILFVISIVVAVFGFSVFVVFATLFLAALILGCVGFFNIFTNFFTSLLSFGLTLILFGFGLLLLLFGVALCTKIIPSMIGAISSIFRKMFSLKKKKSNYQNYSDTTKEITTYEEIN